MCPYHQWTYDLDGSLRAVPFRRGVRGAGGMPDDFSFEEHGLERLAVAERNGVIFASFDRSMPALEDYLGETKRIPFSRT
jgi:salicylate 5-hydroxylase large subunit